MESCQTLCDKPTLQLLKWIETYNICRSAVTKENTMIRRGILREIKKAYKNRIELTHYDRISLFQDPLTQLSKMDTPRLAKWIRRYKLLLHSSTCTSLGTQGSKNMEEVKGRLLGLVEHCMDCQEEDNAGRQGRQESGKHNGG